MATKIALAGNPNSGKTSMFNSLTGSTQYVGNWPGVTVEKKDGRLKGNKDIIIQDLPGIYSLSPYTLEEVVTRKYLVGEKPDSIINIIDATNIERSLYLTTQLTELGIPVVVALNMMDIIVKNGDIIDTEKLSQMLGCPVVFTSALRETGVREAANAAVAAAEHKDFKPMHGFSEAVEETLARIGEIISSSVRENVRWYSLKLFERDKEIIKDLDLGESKQNSIEEIISALEESCDDDSESIITNERYSYITDIVLKCVKQKNKAKLSISDKIDRIVTNRILALPIFAAVMFLVYFISVSTVGSWMTGWVNDTLFGELIPDTFGAWLFGLGLPQWLYLLIMDGIIAGVGAVLGFLPQMLTLFLCLALLEDCGYMARIAFIMDRVFKKFGLSGKSFIPILIGTGCGVPGIMASRTIENQHDRRMTVITTTFIPCGAKLPIIALISGALFGGSPLIASSAYFLGIAAIIISGIMLKKTKLFAGDPSPFIMELPAYHIPGAKGVARAVFDRGFAFVRKASSIVLLATVGVWFLSSFNFKLEMVDTGDSILAAVGHFIAPAFAPLGWNNWEAAVATFTGLIAKENVVGTFGVLYGFGEVAENGMEYWGSLTTAFTPLAAYSFLAFNLLCAPCFAAIGAVRREMMSAKWTWFAIGYQTAFAYAVSLIIYGIGSLVTGVFNLSAILAFIICAFIIFMLAKKPYKEKNRIKEVLLKA